MSKRESGFGLDKHCDRGQDKKIVINSIENVTIKGKKYLARIDTGATKNSICKSIVADLSLGPAVDTVEVKSSNGVSVRDIIVVDLELAGVSSQTVFNVSNRIHMKYPILIGRNLLKKGFLVDCSNEDRDN
jgi:hypothetical protein